MNKTTDISKEIRKIIADHEVLLEAMAPKVVTNTESVQDKRWQEVVRRLEVAVNANIWLCGYMIAPVKYADVWH